MATLSPQHCRQPKTQTRVSLIFAQITPRAPSFRVLMEGVRGGRPPADRAQSAFSHRPADVRFLFQGCFNTPEANRSKKQDDVPALICVRTGSPPAGQCCAERCPVLPPYPNRSTAAGGLWQLCLVAGDFTPFCAPVFPPPAPKAGSEVAELQTLPPGLRASPWL